MAVLFRPSRHFYAFAMVISLGYDLINANSIKLALTLVFTPFSLVVFICYNQVEWIPGLVVATGGILGHGWAQE